ncbi:hypothetical protein AQUCO_00500474v1 [Aquilegia coerulea]|uniref:Uncharacterized protein n=1 Tax=Aquilegia coerulea TaxID=218851 RepID=A0A2G5ESD0_AQUCA|nr:hypothetical protein AQUCO_00500474v1 [Aquilegia coerulea]
MVLEMSWRRILLLEIKKGQKLAQTNLKNHRKPAYALILEYGKILELLLQVSLASTLISSLMWCPNSSTAIFYSISVPYSAEKVELQSQGMCSR